MNDRLFGTFEDKRTAQRAIESLVDGGIGRDRVELKRVIEQERRGLTDTDRVHSLIHAPTIDDSNPVADDSGTLIVIVEVAEGDEAEGYGVDGMAAEMKRLGATETQLVRATPGLDL
jgi:hypothetical protein